jgi:hypothetical protein
VLVLTEPTDLLGILLVPSCSLAAVVAMAVIVGSSSSCPEGTKPIPKKARFGALLPLSSRHVCGVVSYFRPWTQKVIYGRQESYPRTGP